ncbi:hypothetical protein AB205_0082160, partial [Aquarana catesbeiana]
PCTPSHFSTDTCSGFLVFAHPLLGSHTFSFVMGYLNHSYLCTLLSYFLSLFPPSLSTFHSTHSLSHLLFSFLVFVPSPGPRHLSPLGGPCRCSGHSVGRGRWSFWSVLSASTPGETQCTRTNIAPCMGYHSPMHPVDTASDS